MNTIKLSLLMVSLVCGAAMYAQLQNDIMLVSQADPVVLNGFGNENIGNENIGDENIAADVDRVENEVAEDEE